jgi:hypothetical protein
MFPNDEGLGPRLDKRAQTPRYIQYITTLTKINFSSNARQPT